MSDMADQEDMLPGERIAPMDGDEFMLSPSYKPEIDTPGLRCKACKHPQTEVIDQHLISRDLTLDEISKVYGISTSALSRHKSECIVGMVLRGREILKQQKIARKLVRTMDRVDEVYDVGMGLLKHAAGEKNVGDSLALMDKLEHNLRLRGELAGEMVGPNGPPPGMQAGGQAGGQGGRVQVIVLPTTYGRPPEEIAKLIEAKPLVLDSGDEEDEEGNKGETGGE